MEKENYNPYDDDVKIIVEDEEMKLVEVLTKDAAIDLGGEFYGENWDDKYNYGNLYFLISPKKSYPLFSIHNEKDSPSIVRNGVDDKVVDNMSELKVLFPKSFKLLTPYIKYGDTFEFLLSVYRGNEPNWSDTGGDKIIDSIKFNEKFPRSSLVVIVFNSSDDFLKIFDLEDSDAVYYWNLYTDNNSSVNYDRYEYEDHWNEGGFLENYFNDENKQELINLVRTYYPFISPDDYKSISTHAKKIDPDFVDSILDDYASLEADARHDAVKTEILSEFEDVFTKFGIKEKSLGYKYIVPINLLLNWYIKTNSEKKDLTGLLTTLIEKFDTEYRGDWGDLYYNVDIGIDDDDEAYFQREISEKIEKLHENLEDDERFINYDEFIQLQNLIDNEYGFNKEIKFKTNPESYFKVTHIEPSTNKIVINVHNKGQDTTRSVTYDELKKLDTQYELFEQRRKRFGKL